MKNNLQSGMMRNYNERFFLPKIDIENNIKIRISEMQTCCFYLSAFLQPSLSIYQSSGINNRRALWYSTMKCFESCLTVSYSQFISRYHSFRLPSCHLQKLLFHFIAPTLLLFGFYSLLLSSNLLLSPKIWWNKVSGGRHAGD